MRKKTAESMKLSLIIAILACMAWPAQAVKPISSEISEAHQWAVARFAKLATQPPFSFTYDGHPSFEFLGKWKLDIDCRRLDENRTQYTQTYTDPKTGLIVRCVAVEYLDFPTVEWMLYFKNNGQQVSPVIENIHALDSGVNCSSNGDLVLHYNSGGQGLPTDYQPLEEKLGLNAQKTITPQNGLPSDGVSPYFNVAHPGDRAGVIFAIGWQGQWTISFTRDKVGTLAVKAGQETTHFQLNAGEEIRTPLIVAQFYQGDWIRGQNLWRRWFIAHNMPRPGHKPLKTLLSGTTLTLGGQTERSESDAMDLYCTANLGVDNWWIDAGWYPCAGNWASVGSWEVDQKRFSNGLRSIGDQAHSKSLKFTVWFEPGRCMPETWLYTNHPEWMLPLDTIYDWKNSRLLDFGNPEALAWMIDHYDRIITESGIDIYRQDFNNLHPLRHWKSKDTNDRQGITEIRNVEGSLKLYDELIRRHPGLLIDNCSAGGRRNDVETLRRSVPLWRSDCTGKPLITQCQTYGMAFWIPYYGTMTSSTEDYDFRSVGCSALLGFWDTPTLKTRLVRLSRLVREWRGTADNYLGDYYPLTSYSSNDLAWMAWQFDRPEAGKGLVQAFRRPECSQETLIVKLCGLEPNSKYSIVDVDTSNREYRTGLELMEQGLRLTAANKPDAKLLTYEKCGH